MMYLAEILSSKQLKSCPIPLWKLKLSNDQFEELGSHISSCTQAEDLNDAAEDIAVYCAFWWQKKYAGGAHTLQNVKDTLFPEVDAITAQNIQDAATEGLRRIERDNGRPSGELTLHTNNTTAHLDSILYQGGLPLELFANDRDSAYTRAWTRTIISILNGVDTVQGQAADNSESIHEFCDSLYEAYSRDRFRLMPTHCPSNGDRLWRAVIKKIKRIRGQINRVEISWKVKVDDIDKRIEHLYTITVPKELNGNTAYNASVVVCKNNQSQHVFTYLNNYCHNHKFTGSCDETSIIRLSGSLERDFDTKDLAAPLLFEYLPNNSRYMECSYEKIGETELILLLDNHEWSIDQYTTIDYFAQWNRQDVVCVGGYNQYHVLLIPSTTQQITIKNRLTGQDVILTPNRSLNSLSICNGHDIYTNFKEIVYRWDADNQPIIVNERTRVTPCYIQNGEKEDTPHIGRQHIFDSNNMDISPIRNVISLGRDFTIDFNNIQADSCEATIRWPNGNVTPEKGRLLNPGLGLWQIEKDRESPEWIKLRFSANGSSNYFTLHYKAPFACFLVKFGGKSVKSGRYIPIGDLASYRYGLIGDIRTQIYDTPENDDITYSETTQNGEMHRLVFHDGDFRQAFTITSEGGFESIFQKEEGRTGLWSLEKMLDHEFDDVVNAEIKPKVHFNNNDWECVIKRYPYRIDRFWNVLHFCLRFPSGTENNVWIPHVVTSYNGELYAVSLEDDEKKPILIEVRNGQALIPKELRDYGKILILSKEEGLVLPRLEDMSLKRSMFIEERNQNTINAVARIETQLENWTWRSDFDKHIGHCVNMLREFSMPPTSLLELRMIARHSIKAMNDETDLREKKNNSSCHLIRLAFHLFMSDEWERNEAKNFLLSLESPSMLAFKWWWINENEIKNAVPYRFFDSLENEGRQEENLRFLQDWYCNSKSEEFNDEDEEAINNINTESEDPFACMNECRDCFVRWMEDIINVSAEMYRTRPNNNGQIINDELLDPINTYCNNRQNIWDLSYMERQKLLYYITYEADTFHHYLAQRGIIVP